MSIEMWQPGDPVRPCGDEHSRCNACCVLPAIPELEKPAGEWCRHCSKGKGCSIYAERPGGCQSFYCLWAVMPEFPEGLRPDRCRVMWSITEDGSTAIAATRYPDALKTKAHQRLINQFRGAGVAVVVQEV